MAHKAPFFTHGPVSSPSVPSSQVLPSSHDAHWVMTSLQPPDLAGLPLPLLHSVSLSHQKNKNKTNKEVCFLMSYFVLNKCSLMSDLSQCPFSSPKRLQPYLYKEEFSKSETIRPRLDGLREQQGSHGWELWRRPNAH